MAQDKGAKLLTRGTFPQGSTTRASCADKVLPKLVSNDTIFATSKNVEVCPVFDGLDLEQDLLRGIYAYGFERPSAVQQSAILPILKGRDAIVQSQSGSGKTSVFCLGALHIVDTSFCTTQVLLLSPTLELADQNRGVCLALGDYSNVQVHLCREEEPMSEDMQALEHGVHILSGTLGCILALIETKHISAANIKMLVLDEADTMLSRGLHEQVLEIHRQLSSRIQVVMVCTTASHETLEKAHKLTREPFVLLTRRDELMLQGIKQFFIHVRDERWKFATVCDLLDMLKVRQTIIFCNTAAKVDWLSRKLHEASFAVPSYHAGVPLAERKTLLRQFRSGELRNLVSTDMLGLGIDVQQIGVVISYDLPRGREQYLRRIGRCGRFGRYGAAMALVIGAEMRHLRDIEQHYSTTIDELPMNVADLPQSRQGGLFDLHAMPSWETKMRCQ